MAPALASVGLLAVIAWMFQAYLRHRRLSALAEKQVELQMRLLDRFQSAPELLDFLNSDQGQALLKAATLERVDPRRRIMASVQTGTVVTAVGMAMMSTASLFKRFGMEAGTRAEFFSTLTLALGLGFLAAAGVLYLLARKWRMLED